MSENQTEMAEEQELDIQVVEDVENVEEMSFEDLFESFSQPDMPVDFSNYRSS